MFYKICVKSTERPSVLVECFSVHSRRTRGVKTTKFLKGLLGTEFEFLLLFCLQFDFQLQECMKSNERGEESS